MFKFNFYADNSKEETKGLDGTTYSDSIRSFVLTDGDRNVLNLPTNTLKVTNHLRLQYVDENALEDYLRKLTHGQGEEKSSVFDSVQAHEDVKPGLIEGGFTLWDGSKDLVHYISKHLMEKLYGKNVLELGCGCGLPGILAIKARARLVRFQDYNSEVLKQWTIPNVIVNLQSPDGVDRPKAATSLEFFSGDWSSLSSFWQSGVNLKFDYIFTSETIYRSDLYERLHDVIETTLSQDGVILLSYYVQNRAIFQTIVCEVIKSGAVRYVMQMTRL
ncbi:unnamed protein product [Heterobilharzia americana]|nr:unnamed protein product [Heterobilharzia americana]